MMEMKNRKSETRTAMDTDAPFIETDDVDRETVTVSDNIDREVHRLSEELDIERDARMRLAAEYQNYRRRTEQEKARAADLGKLELLTSLLSVADDFDRALDRSSESPEAITEGVRMIRRRFVDILEANGVTAIETVGKPFDPERHEAFDVVAAGDGDAGTVESEMRRGYFWNGGLLRAALVVVRQ